MRLSSLRTTCFALAAAGALGAALFACGEAPTDPAPQFGHIDRGTGHPRPTITILDQPAITPIPGFPQNCRILYSFEISGKGKERELEDLLVLNHWWGGDHHGLSLGTVVISNLTLGSKVEGLVIARGPTHGNDGHSFDALRLQLVDAADTDRVHAEAFTEGATVSC